MLVQLRRVPSLDYLRQIGKGFRRGLIQGLLIKKQSVAELVRLSRDLGAAATLSAVYHCLDAVPVSYPSEFDGRIDHVLTTQISDSPRARLSRSSLWGHTDLAFHPLPTEPSRNLPTSPDLVGLYCVENPGRVATRIMPLKSLIRHLNAAEIDTLAQPEFLFRPQASSSLDSSLMAELPVLAWSPPCHGYIVRFSGSIESRTTASPVALTALEQIKFKLAGDSQYITRVVLECGDVLILSNRTALHGRDRVQNRRTLVRMAARFQESP